MPKRRRSSSGQVGRRVRKRRRYDNAAITRVPRSIGTIAGNRMRAKLRWFHYSYFSTTVSHSYFQYNLGSLYDPNYSGVGDQPAGFDDMMTLFSKYHVSAVKWSVSACVYGTAGGGIFDIGMAMTSADPGGSSSPFQLSLQPYSVHRRGATWSGPVRMKLYAKLANVLGVPPSEYYEGDNYEGTVTTSPTNWPIGTLSGWSADQTTSIQIYYVSKFTFYAEFRKPVYKVLS